MSALEAEAEGQRQASVLQALWRLPADPPAWGEHGERLQLGLAAYQGNARATAERVLAAAYPTVQALLGAEALALLARQLWQHHPPSQGDLTAWGRALPEWLAHLPEVRDWPYLPDCARLDWARHTAESAEDAPFEPDSLVFLGSHDPAHLQIQLRPGLSLVRSDWPVVALWQAHQTADPVEHLHQALLKPHAETAVVWRPQWRAEVLALPDAWVDWMNALAPSTTRPLPCLSTMLDSAPEGFDLGQWLALALQHGWIWRVGITDRAG